MELSLTLLLVMAGLVAMVWLGCRRTRRHRAGLPGFDRNDPADSLDRFDPNDLSELSASLRAIVAEHHAALPADAESRLRSRLQRVISRRSPVRRIAAAPIPGATRIWFADGTGILVRCQQGRLALLAYQASRHPVCLTSCRLGPNGPELVFDYQGGQFTAVVVGFDQAD
ncbi:hypothetical protein [Granulicoccus sp. GXG6511]|uniref:hypothetical protein n=1 Tax=Granulicoccus sp. GXG6511 TaxID=3381351 RepID=UPI003D7CDBD6